MKTIRYHDSLVQSYAVHLLRMITEAEIQERVVYIQQLDELLRHDGVSRLVQMPESCSSYV